jgi:hypothetical protein
LVVSLTRIGIETLKQREDLEITVSEKYSQGGKEACWLLFLQIGLVSFEVGVSRKVCYGGPVMFLLYPVAREPTQPFVDVLSNWLSRVRSKRLILAHRATPEKPASTCQQIDSFFFLSETSYKWHPISPISRTVLMLLIDLCCLRNKSGFSVCKGAHSGCLFLIRTNRLLDGYSGLVSICSGHQG